MRQHPAPVISSWSGNGGRGWRAGGPWRVLPVGLLLATAGLALLGALGKASVEENVDPMRVGPAFWALVVGTGTSPLLEGEAVRALRAPQAVPG